MAKNAETTHYIRFVEDGLLLDGHVWREGAYCATKSDVGAMSADEQREALGGVFFEAISQEEYETGKSGRAVRTSSKPAKKARKAAAPKTAPAPAGVKVEGASSSTHTPASVYEAPDADDDSGAPIEGYADMDIAELLAIVAGMGDEGAATVLAYERSTLNRPEVVKALETGELPE